MKRASQGGRGFDPFDMLFGGGHGRDRRKGPDAHMDLQITLEELYNGAEKSAK